MDADVTDIAKVGGGAGVWAVISLVVSRLLKQKDSGDNELKAELVSTREVLSKVNEKLAVLLDRDSRREAEFTSMKAELHELRDSISDLRTTIAALKGS